MKIKGKQLTGTPYEDLVVIPRGEGNDIVFRVRAVLDYSKFEALCPEPKPPTRLSPGQSQPVPQFESPEYKKQAVEHWVRRRNWMYVQSLLATEDLEFEKVKLDDPSTWAMLKDELKEAGLTPNEVGVVYQAILGVNGMDEDKLLEARRRFLPGGPAAQAP